jgi:hypothetical protein
MKQSIKISVMAIAAMFAFTTVANAQFGALKKIAKKAVENTVKETVKEKVNNATSTVTVTETPQASPSEEAVLNQGRTGASAPAVMTVGSAPAAKKKTVQVIAYDPNYNLGKKETMLTFTLPGTDKKVMAIVPASYTVKSYEAFEGQAWSDKKFMERAKAAIEKKYPTPDNARKGQLKAKLAEIGTRDDHWRYSRNSLGVILDRYIHVYAVYEFEDGEVYLTEFYAVQNNNGAGYDDNIVVNYSSRYGDVKYSIEKWEAKTDIFTSKIGGGK